MTEVAARINNNMTVSRMDIRSRQIDERKDSVSFGLVIGRFFSIVFMTFLVMSHNKADNEHSRTEQNGGISSDNHPVFIRDIFHFCLKFTTHTIANSFLPLFLILKKSSEISGNRDLSCCQTFSADILMILLQPGFYLIEFFPGNFSFGKSLF
jgi:hypothetical protein